MQGQSTKLPSKIVDREAGGKGESGELSRKKSTTYERNFV